MREEDEIDDLEDIIFEISKKPRGEGRIGFSVDSDDTAAWAARKVLEAEGRIAVRSRLAETYKSRIDAWLERATKQDRGSVEYLRSLLSPFLRTALIQVRKGRTIHYPGVSLSLRKLPDKAGVYNDELALSYCEKNLQGAVEVKKSLLKSILKKELSAGKQIPGVELITGQDELHIAGDEHATDVNHVAA